MMKIFLIIILFSATSFIISQNKIAANAGYGYYLHNSENEMKLTGDKHFGSYSFYGISYNRENIFGINLSVEYNYHRIFKNDVIQIFQASEKGSETLVSYGGDLTLISHAIDINYTGKLFNILNFGIGPSFILTNRIFEITVGSTETLRPLTVYDRLASSGLGVNGFFGVTVPFTENEKYFFLISNIKFRYAYSLWYDKGIRNLDNYYQEFLTMQFSFGFGYSF